MKNNTLYASDLTYEFEKARMSGDKEVLEEIVSKMKGRYSNKLEYLDDFYDKDTGEVILVYTEANHKRDIWNDNERI